MSRADVPARQHALLRTSPKGQDFVGRCMNCGATDVTWEEFCTKECPNPAGVTQGQSVLDAIRGGSDTA